MARTFLVKVLAIFSATSTMPDKLKMPSDLQINNNRKTRTKKNYKDWNYNLKAKKTVVYILEMPTL